MAIYHDLSPRRHQEATQDAGQRGFPPSAGPLKGYYLAGTDQQGRTPETPRAPPPVSEPNVGGFKHLRTRP